jgi:hypothetical protein
VIGANSLVTFVPLEETFQFVTAGGCEPFAGLFRFEARLTNVSERDLTKLVVQVAGVSPGVILQNADGRPGGAATRLSLPVAAGRIGPKMSVDVGFALCLQDRAPFEFSVNVFEVVENEE